MALSAVSPPNKTVAKCAATVPPSVRTRQRDGTASAIVPKLNGPADFGENDALWFGYSDASTLLVTVGGAGSAYAHNGDLQIPFANAARSSLQPALGHESR